METKITATELARGLSDVLNRVRYKGERFVIERNGEAVAVLEPLDGSKAVTFRELAERLKSVPRPDPQFADDLEAVQSEQSRTPPVEWPC
jgi:prevent-host-death family protein